MDIIIKVEGFDPNLERFAETHEFFTDTHKVRVVLWGMSDPCKYFAGIVFFDRSEEDSEDSSVGFDIDTAILHPEEIVKSYWEYLKETAELVTREPLNKMPVYINSPGLKGAIAKFRLDKGV